MQPKQPDFAAILAALEAAGVRYVLIGGMAMVAHGSAYVTVDLDVCYSREQENLAALGAALVPFHPRLRTAAGPIPFLWEARTLLPGLDGYEVARRVRSECPDPRLKLVALTDYGQPEDRDRALAAGFDAHLVKPVDRDHLQRVLDGGV